MRIAIVHSVYASAVPSGENAVVLEQVEALTQAGHDVLLVARHTDEESRAALYPLRAAVHVVTGLGPDPTSELEAFGPDVVHVHNLFPNFGTRWLRRWTGPLVATLHNFRPLCANGLLFRDGHYCEECPTSDRWASVKHGCYHGSRLATLPLGIRNARGPEANDVLARADALICLSDEAAALYRRLAGPGLPIHVIPNGIDVPAPPEDRQPNGRWLVVSRLTPEKGVRELVGIWPDGEELDIIGAGPEEEAIRRLARPGVTLLGALQRAEVLARMPHYEGLVFPSLCVEMQPTVLMEAAAVGLPVVSLRVGPTGSGQWGVRATNHADSMPRLADALATARLPPARDGGLSGGHASRGLWVDRLLDLYARLGTPHGAP